MAWLVIIDHGNGWQSLYAHLSQINVSCGQNVGQGDMIGLVGMTGGTSTGPHLHFELMNATLGYVNPLDYLPAPLRILAKACDLDYNPAHPGRVAQLVRAHHSH